MLDRRVTGIATCLEPSATGGAATAFTGRGYGAACVAFGTACGRSDSGGAGGSGSGDEDSNHESQQDWEQPLIIAEPEIEVTSIRKSDQFLLLACDGLFDVFSYDEIVSFVRDNMEKHGDAQRCCQNLTFEAIRKRNSRDNVSVILIILNKWF